MGIVVSSLCDLHRETGDAEMARTIVRAVDFTLRNTYLPDQKVFRYTSCPLSIPSPPNIMFMADGLAYAYRLTGNEKYKRVLQEANDVMMQSFRQISIGKQFSQYMILSPEGLWGLDIN